MTIYEDHLDEVDQAKERYHKELDQLKVKLRAKQEECPHPSWSRHEEMFYAMGNTAPGKQCDECGLQLHVN